MRAFIAILGFAVLAMLAIAGLQAALADGGQQRSFDNESWTPDAGNVTDLENSNLPYVDYNDTVTVFNSSDIEMEEDTDYEWNQTNGTVKALEGGDLENEQSATISYGFDGPSKEQIQLSETAALMPQSIGMMFPIFLLLLFVLILRGGA